MSYAQPFKGLKVIDLSQGLAAPYCAMLLAQHGADVIKVEPIDGDWSRILGTRHGDQTAFSIPANLGKRSLALDLKSPAGVEVLWRLLADADVLIEGFRPGVMARLGFGYETVAARVPRILYVAVSGFGQQGPLAQRPAMDPILQAYTGLTYENRDDPGTPRRIPISIVDMAAGLYSFQAVAAALYARRDEPAGRLIDCSLLQAATAFQSVRLIAAVFDGDKATSSIPPSGSFRTADGWIQLQIVQERDWVAFCAALELPSIATDERFNTQARRLANLSALQEHLVPAMQALSTDELAERMRRAGLMHQPVHTYAEFLQQEAADQAGAVTWLAQDGVPQAVPMPTLPGVAPLQQGTPGATAPHCGQHTREILAEHGYDATAIAALLASRAIAASASHTGPGHNTKEQTP